MTPNIAASKQHPLLPYRFQWVGSLSKAEFLLRSHETKMKVQQGHAPFWRFRGRIHFQTHPSCQNSILADEGPRSLFLCGLSVGTFLLKATFLRLLKATCVLCPLVPSIAKTATARHPHPSRLLYISLCLVSLTTTWESSLHLRAHVIRLDLLDNPGKSPYFKVYNLSYLCSPFCHLMYSQVPGGVDVFGGLILPAAAVM